MDKVIYIADLDQDIDDIIAVEYLSRQNALECVVTDPIPKNKEGLERLNGLRKKNIKTSITIPDGARRIFVGGALTAVAKYISTHNGIETLVMNGGFVGMDIVQPEYRLDKFFDKKFVRTFNFNMDVASTDKVMRSAKEQIGNIILVGKNVCHHDRNTKLGLWNKGLAKQILDEYHVKDTKKQHDMLACHEGLVLISFIKDELFCEYKDVYPITENGLEGTMTKWGSTTDKTSTHYRMVTSAVNLK